MPPQTQAENDAVEEIIDLTRDLVRIRTQGGVDDPTPALEHVARWLANRHVGAEVLTLDRRTERRNKSVGLLARLGDPARGPTYCLTACLDTAMIGRRDAWEHDPTAAAMQDGWLIGRGAADSKVGVAIFSVIMARFALRPDSLHGRLLLLIDSDEHSGRFGAVKELLRLEPNIAGAYIGYAGDDAIRIGARGFYRAKVQVYGTSGHSGASAGDNSQNAVVKAARLVGAIASRDLPAETDTAFGRPPRLTVTQISGGRGYSSVPDACVVRVDIRLTPSFGQRVAARLVRECVAGIDAAMPTVKASRVEAEQSWPAYRLADGAPLRVALADAVAAELGRRLPEMVSGPSNVGNFFAKHGIDATCGFGPASRGIHAADEMIRLDTIGPAFRAYRRAMETLLL